RAAGCQALDELRDLVGILRTEPDGDQTPSTPGLPALIAESTAAGALTGLATRSGDNELSGTGSGLGLAGLRQRVELMHGTLRAGPRPDGGFRLEAVLPAYVPTAEPGEYTERAAEQPAPAARPA